MTSKASQPFLEFLEDEEFAEQWDIRALWVEDNEESKPQTLLLARIELEPMSFENALALLRYSNLEKKRFVTRTNLSYALETSEPLPRRVFGSNKGAVDMEKVYQIVGMVLIQTHPDKLQGYKNDLECVVIPLPYVMYPDAVKRALVGLNLWHLRFPNISDPSRIVFEIVQPEPPSPMPARVKAQMAKAGKVIANKSNFSKPTHFQRGEPTKKYKSIPQVLERCKELSSISIEPEYSIDFEGDSL